METTDARRWLSRARTIEREIRSLEAAAQEERDRVTRIVPGYKEITGGGGSKDPHTFDRLVELEDEISARIRALRETKAQIIALIGQIEDGRLRTVLTDYYIRGLAMEEIATEMHYSYPQIKRFRMRGINAAGKILAEKSKMIQNDPLFCDIIQDR